MRESGRRQRRNAPQSSAGVVLARRDGAFTRPFWRSRGRPRKMRERGEPMNDSNAISADQAPAVADALRLTEVLADLALETLSTGQPVPDDQRRALATGIGRLKDAGVHLPQSLEQKVEEISERTTALVNAPRRPLTGIATWAIGRVRSSRRSTPVVPSPPAPAAEKKPRDRTAKPASRHFGRTSTPPRPAHVARGSKAERKAPDVVAPTPVASKPKRPAVGGNATRHLKRLPIVLTVMSLGIAVIGRRAYGRVMTAKIKRQVRPVPAGVDHAAEAHEFFSREIATPPSVNPRTPANANVLADFYEPVEIALKQAGYLR